MKFSELSKKAKNRAVRDYIEGWQETHDEKLEYNEALSCCFDLDGELEYNKQGQLLQ